MDVSKTDTDDECISPSMSSPSCIDTNSYVIVKPVVVCVDFDTDTNTDSSEEELVSCHKRQADVAFPGQGLAKRIKDGPNGPSKVSCLICFKEQRAEMMSTACTACSDAFCINCMIEHISYNIKMKSLTVYCPGITCGLPIDLSKFGSILPQKIVSRWEYLQLAASFPDHQKLFCPFRDCKMMLINDTGDCIRQAQCAYCRRMLCAQCQAPWHEGLGCNGRQELKIGEQCSSAEANIKGRNCPKCNFYMEKKPGSSRLTCRCGCKFCCFCGSQQFNCCCKKKNKVY